MRKRWMFAIVAAVVAATLAFGPAALASKQRLWFGSIDKQHILLFTTEKISGVENFEPILIDFSVTCHVSGDVFDSEWSFDGFQVPLNPDGSFDLNLGDPLFGPFDWAGTIGAKTASGTILSGIPLYDGQGGFGTQSCDNAPGSAWTAQAVKAQGTGSSHATVHVTVTKDKRGHVHVAVTR